MQHNMRQLAEGNQLAVYKHGGGFELGMTENKSSKSPEQDSHLRLKDCESDALTTRPRCLPNNSHIVLISLFIFLVFQYEY